ncbi:TERF1-interacting nuclear factor 2 [Dissostichus eleginoides]|uniref:TERF1-interacting nuclear factor 2 n=1 Tax=Dissostichus eleginoides TaxID=100907 RepID=A0AAD9EYL5_DISEL|nr:TERF1-interacting nuclear factor 2 [Dissostichus eleginoides]
MYYGLLDEFVTTVLETVPELLTYTERGQLTMGLRAKMVLELIKSLPALSIPTKMATQFQKPYLFLGMIAYFPACPITYQM